jgi:hypothetical protein
VLSYGLKPFTMARYYYIRCERMRDKITKYYAFFVIILVPVKGFEKGHVNSHEKIYPYNPRFSVDITQSAKKQREERLKATNKI